MTSQTIKALIAWASKHTTTDWWRRPATTSSGLVFGEKTGLASLTPLS
jgi:hypothetical protein